MQSLTQWGLVVVGTLYVLGLLIINMDIGRYGIFSLNLARPEYIMAGTLWLFLSLGTMGAMQFLTKAIRDVRGSSRRPLWKLSWIAFFLLGTFGILDSMLSTLSFQRLSVYPVGRAVGREPPLLSLAVFLILLLNSGVLYATFQAIKNMDQDEEPFSLKSFFYATYRGFTPFFSVLQLLGVLYVYVFFAYPYFAKELGGGNKPVVRLFLSSSVTFSGSELELPILGSGETVGPVSLVFESESMFFIKPLDPSETGWRKWLGSRRPVVGIAKSSVSALVYVQD